VGGNVGDAVGSGVGSGHMDKEDLPANRIFLPALLPEVSSMPKVKLKPLLSRNVKPTERFS
jgi:hypothetical protein